MKNSIKTTEERLWLDRISNDSDFELFIKIHPTIRPHKAWNVAKLFPELRESAKYLIDLCSLMRQEPELLLCDRCGIFYLNIIEHLLTNCNHDDVRDRRDAFWQDIISIDPIEFSVFMDSLPQTDFTCMVLSCDTDFELNDHELNFFAKF